VYWHTSGEGSIEMPVNTEKISLFEEPGKEIPLQGNSENTTIPVGNRRYIQFSLSHEEVIDLFSQASILN
jgi:hypothetical protein